MDNEIETNRENLKIVNTAELDYNAHLQTLIEFEELYDNMYILDDHKCGRWILK
jgi:hypothetical protein